MLLKYSVKYLNEDFNKPDHENEPNTFKDEGIVNGTDWNECVARLKELYGEGNVFWFSFAELVDIMTKDEFEDNMWDKEE